MREKSSEAPALESVRARPTRARDPRARIDPSTITVGRFEMRPVCLMLRVRERMCIRLSLSVL